MDPMVLAMVAGGLTLAAGALAVNYKAQYGVALKVMAEAAQFIGAVSDVVGEMQKALSDEKVTPEEIQAISEKLAKFKPLLEEIQKMLVK